MLLLLFSLLICFLWIDEKARRKRGKPFFAEYYHFFFLLFLALNKSFFFVVLCWDTCKRYLEFLFYFFFKQAPLMIYIKYASSTKKVLSFNKRFFLYIYIYFFHMCFIFSLIRKIKISVPFISFFYDKDIFF